MPLRQILTAAGTCLVVTGFFYLFGLGPTTYERTFDQNLAHFPLAASRAQRDPGLRDIFLRKTEAAFDRGGWRAANGALMMSMVTDVETFADDEHINAISRSTMAVRRNIRRRRTHQRDIPFNHGGSSQASRQSGRLQAIPAGGRRD